jgi:hypothetical protein
MPHAQAEHGFRVAVGLSWKRDRHREHVLGLETRLGAEERREAANE